MSESTERTSSPRPMFTGTLRLPPRPAPKAEPPALPVKAPAAAAGAGRIAARVADLAECRRRFPVLFDADRPLPLAIGVDKPLGELIGVKRADRLLDWWTKWPAYLAAVAAGGCRYNLDGSEAGQVTEVAHHRRTATRRAGSWAIRTGYQGRRHASGTSDHGRASARGGRSLAVMGVLVTRRADGAAWKSVIPATAKTGDSSERKH